MSDLEQAARDVLDRAQQYRATFASDTGRKVLADLRECFGGSTQGRSPRQSDVRSAQRDVLLRIEYMLTLAEAEQGKAAAALIREPRRIMALLHPWRSNETE